MLLRATIMSFLTVALVSSLWKPVGAQTTAGDEKPKAKPVRVDGSRPMEAAPTDGSPMKPELAQPEDGAGTEEPKPGDGAAADEHSASKFAPATSADIALVADSVKSLGTQLKTMSDEITALRAQLADVKQIRTDVLDARTDIEALQGKIATLERENSQLLDKVGKLAQSMDNSTDGTQQLMGTLDTDNEARLKLLEKLYVKSAVCFHNWEDRDVRMNVNGAWWTLKPGKNLVFVPFGPVAIHRWTNADPQPFANWKPHENGFIMEFDVGKPEAE